MKTNNIKYPLYCFLLLGSGCKTNPPPKENSKWQELTARITRAGAAEATVSGKFRQRLGEHEIRKKIGFAAFIDVDYEWAGQRHVATIPISEQETAPTREREAITRVQNLHKIYI